MGCNTRMVNVRARRIVVKRHRPAVTVRPKEVESTAMIAAYMRAIARNKPSPATGIDSEGMQRPLEAV